MTKFDIVEKIKPADLISAFFKKASTSSYQLLKKEKIAAEGWSDNYFDWGRNALYWLFKSLKFKAVAFPEFTCPTLVWAAKKAGKKIVLVESDIKTFNLDINKIPKKIKCLVVVHTFGNPVNIKEIRNRFNKLFIIEDCAHALYAKINNQYVGDQGDVVLFSLYKQISNINGAVLLTKNTPKECIGTPRRWSGGGEDAIQQPRRLLNIGQQDSNFKYLKRLVFKTQGPQQLVLNLKRHQYLPEIEEQKLTDNKPSNLCFFLFEKGLKTLKKEIERRRQAADWYYDEVRKSRYLISQQVEKNSRPSFYNFAIRLVDKHSSVRDKLVLNLRKKNIFVGRFWYDSAGSSILSKTVVNLPISSSYNKNDIKHLFLKINETIKQIY